MGGNIHKYLTMVIYLEFIKNSYSLFIRQTTQEKNEQMISTNTSQNKTFTWLMKTWKLAQP